MENRVLALVSAILILLGVIISILTVNLTTLEILIIIISLGTFYVFLLVLLKNISRKDSEIRIIRPIMEEVADEINRPLEEINEIKVQKPKAKNRFVGSEETKTYHTSDCRFAKLIKGKYKVSKKDREYFVENNYSHCKICNPHQRV